MKTIKYTIGEVAWPYAFLLNNSNALGGFKKILKDVFQDYDLMGIDEEDMEAIKASKEIYKLVLIEAEKFYDLQKTLPYKIEVVASHEFVNAFIKDSRHTSGKIEYDIIPNLPYKIRLDESRIHGYESLENVIWFLNHFARFYSTNNPYEVHINKSSMCDYLLKQLKGFSNELSQEGGFDPDTILESFYNRFKMI